MAEAQHGTGGRAVRAASRERRRLDRAVTSRPFDESRNDGAERASQLHFEYNRNEAYVRFPPIADISSECCEGPSQLEASLRVARRWLCYLICLDELFVHRLQLFDHAVPTRFRVNRKIVSLEETLIQAVSRFQPRSSYFQCRRARWR